MTISSRSLLASTVLLTALAAPWGCDNAPEDPFIRTQPFGEPCDVDAACNLDLRCCVAPGATEGVCQSSCTSCDSDAECAQGQPSGTTVAKCCRGGCFYVLEAETGLNDPCIDSADCDPEFVCDYEQSLYPECLGLCRPPTTTSDGGGGFGGAGGAGGSGGAGGDGGMGGSGGAVPTLAAHSVQSGSPVTTPEGCLEVAGATAMPARLLFDQTLAGPTTMVVTGSLTPTPQGPGISGASLVQACVGGVDMMTTVSDCVRSRLELNTYQNEGALALLDPQFAELDKIPWPPGALPHAFVVTFTVDPTQGTATSTLSIDGVSQGSVQTSLLAALAGNAISLLFSQAIICGVTIQ